MVVGSLHTGAVPIEGFMYTTGVSLLRPFQNLRQSHKASKRSAAAQEFQKGLNLMIDPSPP